MVFPSRCRQPFLLFQRGYETAQSRLTNARFVRDWGTIEGLIDN